MHILLDYLQYKSSTSTKNVSDMHACIKLTFGYAISAIKLCDLTLNEHNEVKKLCSIVPLKVQVFHKILFNGI